MMHIVDAVRIACLAMVLAACTWAPVQTADAAELQFNDRAEEQRFRRLASELRCLVCQNQSLEDSHAPLAMDLKKEVQAQMRIGKDDDQIVAYLVDRYGDFVRYRPPLRPGTWLLWAGPPLLLVVAGIAAWRVVRRHGAPVPEQAESGGDDPATGRRQRTQRRATT